MNSYRPIIGITMGDPVGIGPEIILSALNKPSVFNFCKPLVFGDIRILESAKATTGINLEIRQVEDSGAGKYKHGGIDVIALSDLEPEETFWGRPTVHTGRAMIKYITTAIDMAVGRKTAAVVTCPINKIAMQMAGSRFHGHTELLADQTKTEDFAMMLAGDKLRVVLVTIHIPLKQVPQILSAENILKTIKITEKSLRERFGIKKPRIGVAGLNPHAGEGGMFGSEEKDIIMPAVTGAKKHGIAASGPFPPDTIFYHAAGGDYDAVVCMYHDQGLIPFKMIHFTDGVNTTLGLPVIRTSVDHGTAYDIAGKGTANSGSLVAAVNMAKQQALYLLGES